MHRLELTLDTPEANLALDEVLLDAHHAGELPPGGVLRLWESLEHVVVVGRGSRLADEVALEHCQRQQIPVLRRVSGGMAIVAGPGCLMYAVVGPHPDPGQLNIDAVHRYVIETMVSGLNTANLPVEAAGTSDLAMPGSDGALLKVSGNSVRMGRSSFLYHGTLLYDFDLPLVANCLLHPPRSPEYRAGRDHRCFVANLPSDRSTLSAAVAAAWQASDNLTMSDWLRERTATLVETRYSLDEWNLSR